jgi:hypothetical protein
MGQTVHILEPMGTGGARHTLKEFEDLIGVQRTLTARSKQSGPILTISRNPPSRAACAWCSAT